MSIDPKFIVELPNGDYYAEYRDGSFTSSQVPNSHGGLATPADFSGGDGIITLPDYWADLSYLEIQIDISAHVSYGLAGNIVWPSAYSQARFVNLNVGGRNVRNYQGTLNIFNFESTRKYRFYTGQIQNISYDFITAYLFGSLDILGTVAVLAPSSGQMHQIIRIWGVRNPTAIALEEREIATTLGNKPQR